MGRESATEQVISLGPSRVSSSLSLPPRAPCGPPGPLGCSLLTPQDPMARGCPRGALPSFFPGCPRLTHVPVSPPSPSESGPELTPGISLTTAPPPAPAQAAPRTKHTCPLNHLLKRESETDSQSRYCPHLRLTTQVSGGWEGGPCRAGGGGVLPAMGTVYRPGGEHSKGAEVAGAGPWS